MPESLNLTGDIAGEPSFASGELPGRQDWDEGCNDGCGCGVCGNDPDVRVLEPKQGSDVAMRSAATEILIAASRSKVTETVILEKTPDENSQMHQFLMLKGAAFASA